MLSDCMSWIWLYFKDFKHNYLKGMPRLSPFSTVFFVAKKQTLTTIGCLLLVFLNEG